MSRPALVAACATLVSFAAAGAQSAPSWTLTETLRIGGSDTGPKSFSDVRSVVATKAGNIFVLDYKAREIRVFDPRGGFIRVAGRDGAGPGEIRNANGLAIGRDDVVWVNDPGNGRFTHYRADGTFLRQVLIPIRSYGYQWQGVVRNDGQAIDLPIHIQLTTIDPVTGRPASEARMRIVRLDGTADTIPMTTCGPPLPSSQHLYFEQHDGRGNMYRGIPFLPVQQIAITRSGDVWCTTTAEYRLSIGQAGQPTKEVVRLNVAPTPVPDSLRRRFRDEVDSLTRAYGPLRRGDREAMPKMKPVIARIWADDEDRVWVRRMDTPEATPGFDVFDRTGKQIATVRSPGPVGQIMHVAGGNLYTVILDDDDVPAVVRYRIQGR